MMLTPFARIFFGLTVNLDVQLRGKHNSLCPRDVPVQGNQSATRLPAYGLKAFNAYDCTALEKKTQTATHLKLQ